MYGVMKNNKLIAIHKDLEVIESFASSQESDVMIIKIKKDKHKALKSNPHYYDLYLVEEKGGYLPFKYSEVIEKELKSNMGDLNLVKGILMLLCRQDMKEKDIKAIQRTIKIIQREIDTKNTFDIEYLESIKDLYDTYKNALERSE